MSYLPAAAGSAGWSRVVPGPASAFGAAFATLEPRVGQASTGVPAPLGIAVGVDDAAMRELLLRYLASEGMRGVSVSRRDDIVRRCAESDLAILEAGPGAAGDLAVLREIRARSDIPVIMILGAGSGGIDAVSALEEGADDCLARPLRLRELLARIRAVLRGWQCRRARPREADPVPSQFAGWRLDRRNRRLIGGDDRPVALTRGEYALLVAFLRSPRQPLTREWLLEATRPGTEEVFDRSIDVQVMRLRRKLECDPGAPRLIRTERGVGYVLDLPLEPDSQGSAG